jgi:cytochrome c
MPGSRRLIVALALGAALVPSAVHAEEVVAGAAVFEQYCAPCHSLKPGVNRYAPSLAGVIGRKAGTVQGFEYSKALQLQSGLVWNGKTLDEWLRDPHAAVPGTGMAFEGLKNAAQRRAVIEFLEREDAAR